MAIYKLFKNIEGTTEVGVILNSKQYIPFSDDNTDYKEYLAWVADGNTADPAD